MNIEQHSLNFFILFKNALFYFFKDFYTTTFGLLLTFIGYLLPIKNIVHLLVLFFIMDVIFGYWSARVVKKERFSVKIIWQHTIPRLAISIIIITCAFLFDKEYHQDIVYTHKIIGWFISGILLTSIIDNAYKITKWSAFPQIGKLIKDTTKEKTNLDIDTDN
jgi:hypothetical protein